MSDISNLTHQRRSGEESHLCPGDLYMIEDADNPHAYILETGHCGNSPSVRAPSRYVAFLVARVKFPNLEDSRNYVIYPHVIGWVWGRRVEFATPVARAGDQIC